MKSFYNLLANSLIASVTTFFVWIGLIYWGYLETESVITTSVIGGLYLVSVVASGFWFGSIVDHNKKKHAMIGSSAVTLAFFGVALVVMAMAPEAAFETVGSVWLWAVVALVLLGVVAGNIRNVAMPTAVTLLVPEDRRDKANGLNGTVFGVSFALSNVAGGLGIGFLGMEGVLAVALALIALSIVHLAFVRVDEPHPVAHAPAAGEAGGEGGKKKGKLDIKGTIGVVRSVPGLFSLIFFTTFNNFLGGVFISLMDAYGLELVSVKVWGVLWGVLSLGFIVGGLIIAKKGLGKNPVATLFRANMIIWTVCIFMAIQPSIVLLAVAMLIYLCAMPFIEASEQTVIQKVVPKERQGRVFGFAQSIEQAASPVTAFVIGPIAQFMFIPFMTTGRGVDLIGSWYGVGPGRGIGLVFTTAGIIGLIVTIFARRSRAARALAARYVDGGQQAAS